MYMSAVQAFNLYIIAYVYVNMVNRVVMCSTEEEDDPGLGNEQ